MMGLWSLVYENIYAFCPLLVALFRQCIKDQCRSAAQMGKLSTFIPPLLGQFSYWWNKISIFQIWCTIYYLRRKHRKFPKSWKCWKLVDSNPEYLSNTTNSRNKSWSRTDRRTVVEHDLNTIRALAHIPYEFLNATDRTDPLVIRSLSNIKIPANDHDIICQL